MTANQNTIRSFIAIELPDPIQSQLRLVIAAMKAAGRLPVRWLPVENIHLTLKFMGDVEAGKLKRLAEDMNRLSGLQAPFSLTVGGLGAFPSARRPRVVWVGIQAPPGLAELAQQMERMAAKFGIPPEDRPFSPHLTIGRVQQHAAVEDLQVLTEQLFKVKVGEIGIVSVESVCLFRSDLRSSGAIYTVLSRAKLGG